MNLREVITVGSGDGNVNAMEYVTRRGILFVNIKFLNSSLILNETSTRIEGRHHQTPQRQKKH